LGIPTSPGVPAELAALTITLDYNDIEQVATVFRDIGTEIAAVIVEPVAGNMNCITPHPAFLPGLRRICDESGALLIFDEVMTGFRVHRNGAQGLYQVTPDITVLGKIIGGGLPVGAFGGRASIMEQIAPSGAIYQAGTLSGNPLSMASGLATLAQTERPDFYEQLLRSTEQLVEGVEKIAGANRIPLTTNHVAGMFGLFFTDVKKVTNYRQATACDTERFKKFFHGMLAEGVYLAPSPYEAGFVSSSHDAAIIERTLRAAHNVLKSM
jgi:glutamate-1-semialdehyde 2,1-aminomutase